MSIRRKLIALLASLVAFSATDALARDMFVGEYDAKCDKSVQCWWEIDKPKKASEYTVKLTIADRRDSNKVICSVEGTATKSPRGNFLAGIFPKTNQEFRVFPWKGGKMEMHAVGFSPCNPSETLNGLFDPIGY